MEASPLNRSLSEWKGVKMPIVAFRGEIISPPRAPASRARYQRETRSGCDLIVCIPVPGESCVTGLVVHSNPPQGRKCLLRRLLVSDSQAVPLKNVTCPCETCDWPGSRSDPLNGHEAIQLDCGRCTCSLLLAVSGRAAHWQDSGARGQEQARATKSKQPIPWYLDDCKSTEAETGTHVACCMPNKCAKSPVQIPPSSNASSSNSGLWLLPQADAPSHFSLDRSATPNAP